MAKRKSATRLRQSPAVNEIGSPNLVHGRDSVTEAATATDGGVVTGTRRRLVTPVDLLWRHTPPLLSDLQHAAAERLLNDAETAAGARCPRDGHDDDLPPGVHVQPVSYDAANNAMIEASRHIEEARKRAGDGWGLVQAVVLRGCTLDDLAKNEYQRGKARERLCVALEAIAGIYPDLRGAPW